MQRTRDEYRTYPIQTAGEVIATIFTALSFTGALALMRLYGDSFFSQALAALALVIFFLYLVPRLVAWLMQLFTGSMQAQAEYKSTTPDLLQIEAKIELEQERRRSLEVLRGVQAPQIEYALKLMDFSDVISISGSTVSWIVDGQSIPLDFAIEWMEAYQARPGNQLPAQSDFSASPERDAKRGYAKAIATALMRAGYVRDAGGPIPPRWIVPDELTRSAALQSIGLELAYDLANYMVKERA